MATVPTGRSQTNTKQDHLDDHAALATRHNAGENRALFSAHTATTQTIANTAVYKPDTVDFDTAAGWNATTGEYTVPRAAKYAIRWAFKRDSTSSATALSTVAVNGTARVTTPNLVAASYGGSTGSVILNLASGDKITLVNNSGASLITQSDSPAWNTYMQIEEII